MSIEIISASAGSGKTHRLTELLEEAIAGGGVRPQAVLGTTFTNKAAAELQERVRMRLLQAGLAAQAQQLSAARIGTVNSVCGRLVGDFAFELGLSPELRVLSEDAARSALNHAVASVLTAEDERTLADLSERMVGLDGHSAVAQVLALARSNGINAETLAASAERSWDGFRRLLGTPVRTSEALDTALQQAMRRFLAKVPPADSTKVTQKAKELVQALLGRMDRGVHLPWKDWVALAKVKAAVGADPLLEPVRAAAGEQFNHPRLLHDAESAIRLVFDLAGRALSRYQQHKRELGAIDFVDQETYALALLQRPGVQAQLREELDLVLVDEFQDTSPIQLAIFLRLGELAARSIWVGDQKQAIYGFRGADPSLMDAAVEGLLGRREPETLVYSYRSRPGLVRLTSALFAPAFDRQGIPAERVRLEPKDEKEPGELGPYLECWQFASKNLTDDAACVASATRNLLADKSVQVRDRRTQAVRPARAGDVAILCRTNKECLTVAEALAALGIRPVLPRQGLLATLEGRVILAGLRFWVDQRDSLAAAELARMVDFAGREDEWLAAALGSPGGGAFSGLPRLATLAQLHEACRHGGVLSAFDAVVEALGVLELCRRWGDAEARLANVEAFRSHVVQYLEGCGADGSGCTTAGLVAYLVDLAQEEGDSQGVDEDDHAVVVSTWHGCKGIEWPIVVLCSLKRRENELVALGVRVQKDGPAFDLAHPLADRWLRYWPNPYAPNNSKTPFHQKLSEHAATADGRARSEREELRLLYVGWTRARDRVVIAGREGEVTGGTLQLLRDKVTSLVTEPDSESVVWAGHEAAIVLRKVEPSPPHRAEPRAGEGYVAAGPRPFVPAFVQPSGAQGITPPRVVFESLGSRATLGGNCDYASLGMAIHGFICADRPSLSESARQERVHQLLASWNVTSAISGADVIRASDALRKWVHSRWPDAVWHREWPISYRDDHGSIVRGSSDLVLECPEGFVIIDHKSFPGTREQIQERLLDYAAQLQCYAGAVEAASGKRVISMWIHLPITGIAAKVSFAR